MSIQIHVARTDNPHMDTKELVGLGELENYPIADTETILAMSSGMHYLSVDSLPDIKLAFIEYMKRIGLMDEFGNFIRIPVDTLGTEWFILQDSNFILRGLHPSATTVDAIIKSDGVVVATTPRINVVNGTWDIDVSPYSLVPGNTYTADLVYWDAVGVEIGTAVVVVESVGISVETFTINEDTEYAYLNGLFNNYDTVTAEVRQGSTVIYTGNAVLLNNTYAFDLGGLIFDKLLTYTATVVGHYGDITSVPIVVDNTLVASPLGTITYVDPATGLTNYDFREFQDLSDVDLIYVDLGVL